MTLNFFIGLVAAFAAATIGSGWQIASRYAVTTTLGPLDVAALRYVIPALVLSPLLLKTGLLPRGLPRARLALLVMGSGLPFGLVVMSGAQWAPAAHIGVFMAATMPLFTALGVWLLDGERVTGMRLLGLALIVAGVSTFGAASFTGVISSWRGDLLFFLAAMLWAAYTLAFRGCGLTPWQGIAVVNAWSSLLLVPLLAYHGTPGLLSAPRSDVAFQALSQGVVAGLLGWVTYSVAINRLGAARASLSAALVPLLTASGAALFLHEPVTATTLVAVVVLAAGIALAARKTS